MPVYLAGRKNDIESASESFNGLTNGIPVRSIAYTGFRGVGKTVLLNRLQEIAEEKGIASYHIEVTKAGSFISKLNNCCRKYLRTGSFTDVLGNIFTNALDSLKALELSFEPENNKFSLSMQEKMLYSSTDISQNLQDLFESIGELAKKKARPICFFIDEFQYSSQEEMDAFILAVHRTNQLSYPLMTVCAGTPELLKMLYKEKTYVERLFIFPRVELLSVNEVGEAISIPAAREGLKFDDAAIERIFEITQGYPYFVQQYGQIIYKHADSASTIDLDITNKALPEYYSELDNNFYMIRYEDRGDLEKQCLSAMAGQDSLPCRVSDIAKTLKKEIKQISPTLSRLKVKGLVTFDNPGEVDFTVPGFADYLKRRNTTKN